MYRASGTEIYVAAHKPFREPAIDGYRAIEAGAIERKTHFSETRDDTGENISVFNHTFCELTALYWIWKNAKETNVGLCHYRRYFSRSRVNPEESLFLTGREATAILREYDIILPEQWYWRKHTVAQGYVSANGREADLCRVKKIITYFAPEYTDCFDAVMNSHKASYCNMLITSKTLYDDYCRWLFAILFELEKQIDLTDYNDQERRVFGYLGELLLNVWVKRNKLKVCYKPIVFVPEDGHMRDKQRRLILFDKWPFTRPITKTIYCMDAKI